MDVTALFVADAIDSGQTGMDVRGAGWVYIDVPDLPASVEVTFGAIAHVEPRSAPQLLLFSCWIEDGDRRVLQETRFSDIAVWPQVHSGEGVPSNVVFGTQVAFTALTAGRYWLVVEVEGAVGGARAVPFAVRLGASADWPAETVQASPR